MELPESLFAKVLKPFSTASVINVRFAMSVIRSAHNPIADLKWTLRHFAFGPGSDIAAVGLG